MLGCSCSESHVPWNTRLTGLAINACFRLPQSSCVADEHRSVQRCCLCSLLLFMCLKGDTENILLKTKAFSVISIIMFKTWSSTSTSAVAFCQKHHICVVIYLGQVDITFVVILVRVVIYPTQAFLVVPRIGRTHLYWIFWVVAPPCYLLNLFYPDKRTSNKLYIQASLWRLASFCHVTCWSILVHHIRAQYWFLRRITAV